MIDYIAYYLVGNYIVPKIAVGRTDYGLLNCGAPAEALAGVEKIAAELLLYLLRDRKSVV